MARTKPIEFLKGNYSRTGKGKNIRTILVGFQFVLSVSAIIIILLMDSQLKYLINSDIGFDAKNLMIIRARNDEVLNSMESFRQEISRFAGIESTTFAFEYPGLGVSGQAFNWETEEGEMLIHAFPAMWVEKEFPNTMGLQMVEGDNFDNFSGTDTIRYFLVNESLVREMGWTSAVGKKNDMGVVIGVVKDFNHNSLHRPLGGAFICLYPVPKNNLGIKIKDGSETAVIEYIKEKWSDFAPGIPISYSFLEDDIANSYSSDKDQQKLLAYLAIICIIISGLGLFGVTAQLMNNKLKEVTIRKVFGAEKVEVISVLFKNIIYLIGTAMILAIPITMLLYNEWIQNFASQVDIKVGYFLIADLGVLVFTTILSSYHGIQVMNSKPIDKLRCE